jgi:phosphoglycolate phosphatase
VRRKTTGRQERRSVIPRLSSPVSRLPATRRAFVVFDLDGTLIDGYEAIGDALAYAMERFGRRPLSPEKVRAMVGHGIEKLLEEAVGAERAREGVRLFRERYPEVAVEKSHLLPGVREVLAELAARGHAMAVASNKPAPFSRMILEANRVARYFVEIAGPDEATPAKPNPAMLQRLMVAAGAQPRGTVVVGDMEVDFEFGRAADCRVVLVPGGSRAREELEKVPSDGLIESLAELPPWLARTSL